MRAETIQVAGMDGRDHYEWLPQRCPICEVAPKRRLGRRGGSAHRAHLGVECEIWRCGQCGLIFPDPMPMPLKGVEQHYGVEADEYFEHHQLDDKNLSAFGLLTQAKELTRGKGKLLDIGAGRGELLRAARAAGWEVTGIEPSSRFAAYAATYSGASIRSQPVEQCAFPDNSFDCVVLSAVLEHLYNPDETIGEISRILRRGGAVFIDVPNEEGLYFKVGNLYQRLRGRDWVVNVAPTFSPFHIFGFSPRPLRALLSKHGLRPHLWRVYPGRAMVPSRSGIVGRIERLAAQAVTALSKLDGWGTYIETWAIKL
jgi:2-polyprenyl-3-methyl-5-hydroxy-6-metoxy-1,4-benzoquinol methylase